MKITEIRIVLSKFPDSKVRAFASVTFDEEFVVHDFRVVEGVKGLFLSMPSKKMAEGEYREVAHPIQAVFRENLQEQVLRAYQDELARPEHRRTDSSKNLPQT